MYYANPYCLSIIRKKRTLLKVNQKEDYNHQSLNKT